MINIKIEKKTQKKINLKTTKHVDLLRVESVSVG